MLSMLAFNEVDEAIKVAEEEYNRLENEQRNQFVQHKDQASAPNSLSAFR